MKVILNFIRWGLGVFLCLLSLGGYMNGDYISSLFVLAFGLLLLPPVSRALFKPKQPKLVSAEVDSQLREKYRKEIDKKIPTGQSTPVANLIMSSSKASIIEVTEEAYKIPESPNNIPQQFTRVPVWSHRYIYSFSDLSYANEEQVAFYQYFKQRFLDNIYIDLEGNTNYAFILLFDLLGRFDQGTDLHALEGLLRNLGNQYPKTRSYASSFLIEKLLKRGNIEDANRIRRETGSVYYTAVDSDFNRLGTKYKKTLGLTPPETSLLNKLWYPGNVFYNIEFCQNEIVSLFLKIIRELEIIYQNQQTTTNKQFTEVADIVARKHFRYRLNSSNYKYCLETTIPELYILIFKYAENAIREEYEHKRKITVDSYATPEVSQQLEERILAHVKNIIPKYCSQIKKPDETTEIELNSQNTTRWKNKFDEIIASSQKNNTAWFLEQVTALGNLNKQNPSVENIYFEASKFISKTDRHTALRLYIQYIYHDLNSKNFDNKPIAKTIQKNLFDSDVQLKEFETIVNELIKNKDLSAANNSISKLYAPKRKKISLNAETIAQTNQKYKGTVELLNEFLKDETVDEASSTETITLNTIHLPSIGMANTIENTQETASLINLNTTQTELLGIFLKHSWSMPQSEVNNFAKTKGLFTGQLIESINDSCYEHIDDLLIEEDADYYVINEVYYKTIFPK